jgi:hypothetical protein
MKSAIIVPTKVFNLTNRGGSWIGGWKHSFQGSTNGQFKDKGFTSGFESFDLNQVGNFSLKIGKGFYDRYKEKLNLPKIGSRAMLEGENSISESIVDDQPTHTGTLKKGSGIFQ